MRSPAQRARDDDVMEAAMAIPSEVLLAVLSSRGGHPGALADAALLCIKKSQDYNHGQVDIHNIDRSGYFPFGAISFAQMLHTKTQRFNSLVKAGMAHQKPNFEGLIDTALDIVNYAGFYIDYARPKVGFLEVEERARQARENEAENV